MGELMCENTAQLKENRANGQQLTVTTLIAKTLTTDGLLKFMFKKLGLNFM